MSAQRTYIIPIKSTRGGVEARLFLTPGPQVTQASAIVFTNDAGTLRDYDSHGYNGYCDSEIAQLVLGRLEGVHGILSDDIESAIANVIGDCTCDDWPDD